MAGWLLKQQVSCLTPLSFLSSPLTFPHLLSCWEPTIRRGHPRPAVRAEAPR